MKAIRNSDGKVIEVREWRGASDVIYSELDMSAFYQDSDLDFSVDEAKEAEGEVISGWVARNEDGTPYLHRLLPERGFDDDRNVGIWCNCIGYKMIVPKRLFPSLTCDDDPIEVEITIKPKKKSSTK